MISMELALTLAFMISLLAIHVISPIAARIGLVDVPCGRKHHIGDVPLVGGIAVFIGVLTSATLLFNQSPILNLYLISCALIVFLGAIDDFKELSVEVRIVGQVIVSSILVYGANVSIDSFGNILGFGVIELGWIGMPLTILAVIACINAFNMMDGIDGLAGFLSLNSFFALSVLMLMSGDKFAVLPLLVAFAILPYLAFNLGLIGGQSKKIFMGDAGSMFVGLSIIWMLLIGSQGDTPTFNPVTSLWLIAIPFWDMCAITLRRIISGRSPFLPDRQHLHHILLTLNLSPQRSLLVITLLSIACSAFGVLSEMYEISEAIIFGSYLCCFITYYVVLIALIQKARIEVKNS